MADDTSTKIIEIGERPKADFYHFEYDVLPHPFNWDLPDLYQSIDTMLDDFVAGIEWDDGKQGGGAIVVDWMDRDVLWADSSEVIGHVYRGSFADRQEV